MISLIKFLKIVLPVATVATATVATVSLVSFKKIDLDKNKDNEDRVLDDLELKAKEFKEKKMLYSKNGKNDSVTLEDDSLTEEILKKFQNNEDLGELEGKVPNIEELKRFLSENKDVLTNTPSPSGQEKSDKDALVNKPLEEGQEINNRGKELPKQSIPPQDALSKPDNDEVTGMQSDQKDQDGPDINRQNPDPKVDEKGDGGASGDSVEQKDDRDPELQTSISVQDDSQIIGKSQDQEGERKTEVDETGKDDEKSKEYKDKVESDLDRKPETEPTIEDPETKTSVNQESMETKGGSIDSAKNTNDPEQSGPEIKQLLEDNERDNVHGGHENSRDEGISSEGKKQLSLKEIQELEQLKKEMEDLTNSLKILSL